MSRFFRIGRSGAALALVMVLELVLFVDCHYRRWQEVIAPLGQAPEKQGEGLVIRGNGLGYYAWLRSLLIDHDWNFDNEFDEHGVSGDYVPPRTYQTELGRRANQWSVGPASIWAVFVVPGHGVLKLLGDASPWAADGYSLPYQFLVGAATLTMSMIGLCLLYGICRQFARPSRAALAAAFLTLGSTLVYYGTVEVSMAHGVSAAVLAALVWYWVKSYGSLRWSRWLLVGLLVGAAALMRWQLATFAVLPAGEVLLTSLRTRAGFSKRLAGLGLAALGALVAFLPQMVAWRCVYGTWLVEPVPQVAHHWLSPSLWGVLLSSDRSLFYWTPICALACLGYFVCRPSACAEPMSLLFAAFGVQVYALASVWGKGEYLENVGNFAGAFLSKAYGMRHLTETVVALAPGLAILLERTSRAPFRLLCVLGFFLGLWNLLLIYEYTDGLLPADAGAGMWILLTTTFHFVAAEPWIVLVVVEALGLICMVLLWGNEEPAFDVGKAASPVPNPKNRDNGPNAPLALRWATLILLLAALLLAAFTPSPRAGFLYRDYRESGGREVKYALFIPHNYRDDKTYPVLMYLHGSGPRNWDGIRPPQEPLATAIREQQATFDMIAVFPQSETGSWDADSPDLTRALKILEEVEKTYRVDPDRVSLTGMSRGGFGVWSLAAAHPRKWAAIVPVCGGGNPQDAAKIRHIPCWCFHGELDNVIPVQESRRMIEALRLAGSNPRYDEYRGVGHNCWDRAYRTVELFPWLRRQTRTR